MYQSPTLVEALVRDRVAELRQSTDAGARGGREKRPKRLIEVRRHRSRSA